jgi:hypothetical protein
MMSNRQPMRILARHHWVDGATITESISKDGRLRRFTATIRGFRYWRIYEGPDPEVPEIIEKIREIRDRIDSGDESVFQKAGYKPVPAETR